ncbi:MAG: ribonucleoside-diphosphate reductase, adenosylcobalamin-dependent, partial [Rhodospirillaceae bacterium]
VFDPRGGPWMKGKYVPSLLAAIGGVIERHLVEIGFLASPEQIAEPDAAEAKIVALGGGREVETDEAGGRAASPFRQCPKCAQASLIRQESCDTCTSCGYSKCG